MQEEGAELDRIVMQWQRERPDIDPECMAVCGAIWRAGKRLSQGLKENLERFDLDFPSMDVLLTLRRQGAGQSMSPSKMATDMMLSTAAMTARLDRLESRGLIERQREAKDRRGVSISLTKQGFSLADDVVVGHATAEDAMLASLDAKERAELRALLARVAIDKS
nr:MarR family transcriptional regulator [uncultured Halomonas sp.]